uniref:Natriuretic peptide n=1 Tax=Nothobranchius furzeri TaxID=105023 RepID=A0A8C6PB66_NOTFU
SVLQPDTSARSLRSENLMLLSVPRTRLKTRGDRAFAVAGPKLWNELPLSIRASTSVALSSMLDDVMGDTEDDKQPPNGLDEAEIREFFSAKNLKSLRNDSTRRSSGCFGQRMDRIGSMSSLGCNTIGRFSRSRN